ncbi:MAG: hypothetical protein ACAI44_24400 [Candidatus Sericytochromatia bacterium]
MNSPLNFSSGAAASLRQAQANAGVRATGAPAAPTPATAAPAPAARQGLRPQPAAAPVHLAAEEMERHINEALEQSPVLTKEEAPLIDIAHLDAPPEDVQDLDPDTDVPEPEDEGFETVEFAEVDAKEDPYAESEDDGMAEGSGPDAEASYLAQELKIYQQDAALPAKRQTHLLKDHQGSERPGAAALAVACEAAVGGLARTLPVMPGDFVGLAGDWLGKSFGVLAFTNPNQLQAFVQELRQALARSDRDCWLLDLARVPATHQGYVLKTLPSCGARPRQVLIWLGQGKRQWNS